MVEGGGDWVALYDPNLLFCKRCVIKSGDIIVWKNLASLYLRNLMPIRYFDKLQRIVINEY